MKHVILLLFFSLFTVQVFAQPDNNEKKAIKIPAKETEKIDSTLIKFEIKPNEKASISKTDKNFEGASNKRAPNLETKKKEFSMFDNSTLRDPGEIFDKRHNAQAVEQGYKIEYMEDQFLGDVRINGDFANIICRDHEFPDGDRVRVLVNDEIFILSLLLTSDFKGFKVPLQEGINRIVFLALNQGDSGPNTAEFQVFDDNKVLVSSKKWNLLTGVKATILVIKDNSFPTLKKTN